MHSEIETLKSQILQKDEEINDLKLLLEEYENIINEEKVPVVDTADYERQLEELLERALNAEEELEVIQFS